jgi:6-phosphogluconolactonase (cycloisomerase 2 family)
VAPKRKELDVHRLTRILASALVAAAALVVAGAAMASGGNSVYTLTNSATGYGNAVAVFDRAGDGSLTPAGTVLTGGLGTGAGLGSQGALTLAGNHLVAVNAGSNTISLFRVGAHGPGLRDIEPSGGLRPISVTVDGRLVYVLNAGDGVSTAPNIAGFWIWHQRLVPLAGSTQPLSGLTANPAQIQFTPGGNRLVVTEKGTSLIDTYKVGFGGYASGRVSTPAAGATPFGFDIDNKGRLFVSEAVASQVSSYAIAGNGSVTGITTGVVDHQGAACWVAVNDNGKYAYTANASTGSISGFAIDKSGGLTLLNANGLTASVPRPLDLAFSDGSRYLYALANGATRIDAFRVNADGSLTPLGSTPGVGSGMAGLAAS